ncbi:MAG TPA: bifunctional DNA-formamidopyrimidine glycosylase/DNA-(apurinic or apyrimidinic site) lyase [Gemmatimonadaceae bacterium]|nr:bifunctional DNA-formamidopyrimidine glycosylase/DNA-(apurinic or apyrimidinic site) lyase [Gemmatimonadaceae bacterium]
MPELPEVERAARAVTRAALGKIIAAVKPIHPSLKKKFTPAHARAVKGKTIERIERRGKHQLLHLDGGSTLVIHFRMNGDWEMGTIADDLDRFARAVIELQDGTRISLVDRRALSSITLDRDGGSSLPRLGREANDATLDAAYLAEALSRKKIAIKPALLDQSVIAGLGNIYAAEALWEAQIDPRISASTLSEKQRVRLVDAIRNVLSPRRKLPGRYTQQKGKSRFAVYDKEGKECRRCGGTIERIVQGGRSTYFCPDCQNE